MVFINYATRQISVKIVYYGPGLSGKTTNLHYVYQKTDRKDRGELVSLDTDTERTLFFDLLPMEVGKIAGLATKIQLYTVPGQVHYNTTRKLVLKGVDGVVFVVDSQAPLLEANKESFRNLLENMAEDHIRIEKIPLVFQYNKRDLSNVLPLDTLNSIFNPRNLAYFEASAIKGEGVFETLREITRQTLGSVKGSLLEAEKRREKSPSDSVTLTEVQRRLAKRDQTPPEPEPVPPFPPQSDVVAPVSEDAPLPTAEPVVVPSEEPVQAPLTLDEPLPVVEPEAPQMPVLALSEEIPFEAPPVVEAPQEEASVVADEVVETAELPLPPQEEGDEAVAEAPIFFETPAEKPEEEAASDTKATPSSGPAVAGKKGGREKQHRQEEGSVKKETHEDSPSAKETIAETRSTEEKRSSLKELTLKIPIDVYEGSDFLWLQFSDEGGKVIKKWKLSKDKISDGGSLGLEVNFKVE